MYGNNETSHWNTKIYTTPHHNTALLLEPFCLQLQFLEKKNPSRFTNTLSMGNEECLENISRMKNHSLKGKLHNLKFLSSWGL